KPASPTWTPPVLTISGLTGQGLEDLWSKTLDHRKRLEATGELAAKRRAQDTKWMWALVHERLHERLTHDPILKKRVPEIEKAIAGGALSPNAAASEIVALLGI
ncbi:MAG: methylmalonyl Co-A mutase-associated GTPase MeaB, partial [Microvirga sp.]